MRRLLIALLLLSACASTTTTAAPPAVPEWDAIPAGVSAALCTRLQMDGIGGAGSEIALVKITQPIASAQALAALGRPKRNRRGVQIIHRALPVGIAKADAGGCAFRGIDALDPKKEFDQMVIELSAPVADPTKIAAGIVARASLGGTHPLWYWIELFPRGDGWFIGRILPLPL